MELETNGASCRNIGADIFPADGRFGFFFDLFYSDLGKELARPPGDFGLEMAFVEFAGTFALGENTDVFYGLRYTTLDVVLDFDFSPPPISPPILP